MKLYMVPLAPNPTKVMLYIAERAAAGTELPIQQIVVNTVKGRHREPEHLARNPFGTLPVLEFEDGSHLIESLAIIELLEDRFPAGALRETDIERRAQSRDLERVVDLRVAGPMARYAHATKSPLGLPPDPGAAAAIEESLQGPLDYLEALMDDRRALLTGERVAIADCTMQAALQFLRFVGADLLGERPNLRSWDTRYRNRQAARQVLKW